MLVFICHIFWSQKSQALLGNLCQLEGNARLKQGEMHLVTNWSILWTFWSLEFKTCIPLFQINIETLGNEVQTVGSSVPELI